MAERHMVQAKQAFSIDLHGSPFMVAFADRFWSDDPVVRRHPNLFGEVTVRSSRPAPKTAPAVETASAEPGSSRRITRPRKADEPEKETSDA